MAQEEDLREVMEEEKRRSRRPLDTAARERRHRELQMLRQMMLENDEKQFREIIVRLGLAEGSREYDVAIEAWRETQKRRKL